MTVYDCCMFLNENDLYEIKLNQHWDFVDKFIVLEAAETHTGVEKPFNFDEERFKKYSEKLIYKTLGSFDKEIPRNLDLLDGYTVHSREGSGQVTNDWVRDNFQANYLVKILKEEGAKSDDIILMGCLDEIINETAFYKGMEHFKNKEEKYGLLDPPSHLNFTDSHKFRPIFGFMLDVYVYKFNLYHDAQCTSMMTEFSNFEIMLPATLRGLGLHTHECMEKAGWHFTFFDGANGEMVLEKQRSWAHSKDRYPGQKVKFTHTTKEEALERMFHDYKMKKVEISVETHPKYLMENLEKYKKYIL